MCNPKILEDIAETPNTDLNTVPSVDLIQILFQIAVRLPHDQSQYNLVSLLASNNEKVVTTLIISGVNIALLPSFFFPPSISPHNRCFRFERWIVETERCVRRAICVLVCPLATKVSASSFSRGGIVSGIIRLKLRQFFVNRPPLHNKQTRYIELPSSMHKYGT